jgi:three-Cys-motif partner protein
MSLFGAIETEPVHSAPVSDELVVLEKAAVAKSFFNEQKAHSELKAQILEKYVPVWAGILIRQRVSDRVIYIDLFSGPGIYKDGSESTPILVLKQVIQKPELHNAFVSYFSDADADNVDALKLAVSELSNLKALKYAPIVERAEITSESHLQFAKLSLVPAFLFFDPFGYKTLSVNMIQSILKNPGSECIFFFNYNRINPAIQNPVVRKIVDAIFGKARVDKLQAILPTLDNAGTEAAIIGALRESLFEIDGKYVVPFGFRSESGKLTHHLVFVGKHPLGHKIIKEVLAKFSTGESQGVPDFEFTPVPSVEHFPEAALFGTRIPGAIDLLKAELLKVFAGRRLSVQDIFLIHNVGRRYLLLNYKEALKQLCREGRASASRAHKPEKLRPRPPYIQMPEDVVIEFQ